MAETALVGAGRREQRRLQRGVGHLSRQWPAQPSARQPFQRQPDGRRRDTYSAGNLIEPDPGGPQTKHVAHSAHWHPLCWHPLPRAKAKERTLTGPTEAPSNRARSSRNGGRKHLGTPSHIQSEWSGCLARGWFPGVKPCLTQNAPPASLIVRPSPPPPPHFV